MRYFVTFKNRRKPGTVQYEPRTHFRGEKSYACFCHMDGNVKLTRFVITDKWAEVTCVRCLRKKMDIPRCQGIAYSNWRTSGRLWSVNTTLAEMQRLRKYIIGFDVCDTCMNLQSSEIHRKHCVEGEP